MTLQHAVARQYRARLQALRDQIVLQARRLYGALDAENIAASFDHIVNGDPEDPAFPGLVPYLEAGKGSAAALSAAFVNQLALYDSGSGVVTVRPPTDKAANGDSLAAGLAPIAGMILGQIAAGQTVADAVGYGDYLVSRFADSEVLRTADQTVDDTLDAERHRYTGWTGVVSPGACDACVAANSGDHSPDETLYRHANCGCERIPIFEGA